MKPGKKGNLSTEFSVLFTSFVLFRWQYIELEQCSASDLNELNVYTYI